MFKAGVIYIRYLLFAIILTSCVQKTQNHGVNLDNKMVTEVKEKLANDTLTIQDLTNILGPYSAAYQVNDNIHVLYINYERTTPPIQKDFISKTKTYEFIATNNNIVKLNEYDKLNEIALNDNATIYEKTKFNIFKQIFSNVGRIGNTNDE